MKAVAIYLSFKITTTPASQRSFITSFVTREWHMPSGKSILIV